MTELPWLLADLPKPGPGAPTCFSCFACGGGSTMGYKLAGFRVHGCNEIDPEMMKIYVANHRPALSYEEPIQSFKKRDDLPPELFELDVLDGSPPCSVFSMAGHRERDWGREKVFREGQALQVLDDLFFHFIDLADRLRPKVVVAENVKGLLFGNARGYVREIMASFRRAGYVPQMFLLNASRMGVAQRRERVFFIATREDLKLPMILLQFGEPEIPARVAIEGAGGERKPLTGMKLRLWRKVRPGQSFSVAHPRKSYFNHYRFDGDKPVPTIAAFDMNAYAHWSEPADLSSREIARLQSFPDDFDFCGMKARYVCGMSVPPLMMERLAAEIRRQLIDR